MDCHRNSVTVIRNSCSLLIRGLIVPAVRQKLHLASCTDFRSRLSLALAPPTQAGMASAMVMIVRQAGFAISTAALGVILGAVGAATGFAQPFAVGAFVASLGMIAASVLLPAKFA